METSEDMDNYSAQAAMDPSITGAEEDDDAGDEDDDEDDEADDEFARMQSAVTRVELRVRHPRRAPRTRDPRSIEHNDRGMTMAYV